MGRFKGTSRGGEGVGGLESEQRLGKLVWLTWSGRDWRQATMCMPAGPPRLTAEGARMPCRLDALSRSCDIHVR